MCLVSLGRSDGFKNLTGYTGCFWNTWHQFTGVFYAESNEKGLVNMDTWTLHLWVLAHFVLEGEGWNIQCKPIDRKVFIYKLLIPTLQITDLTTTNYKIFSKCCPCVSTQCTGYVIKDCCICSEIPGMLQSNLHLLYWVEWKFVVFSNRWRKHKLYCHLFKPFWCLSCHYINYASNGNYVID
jgi:hypothetical protein